MAKHKLQASVPGVVYLSPAPEENNFKESGAYVTVGETLALIEVMKSFMPIKADAEGTFYGYCVENQTSIEVGDAICEIEETTA